ncbi:hypothetical protein HHK36_017291 [Tetracentron sinense]|uniref:Leucine-rich repeat-containing N-terminal plant-type domain-containing protein n=1 Tax=Tetracentron sinense TaxID=13715 RepID=A0A834YYL8_TETSI|nr:hypothetical protein HHK36_017291 [Tetracentron sinense]
MGKFSVLVMVLAILCLLSREFACNGDTHLAGCSESDRKALIDFKNGLNDPENRLSSWRGSDCCDWRGVGCDNSTGAVIAIDLHNPHPYNSDSLSRYGFWNLSGEINPALLRLKSLRNLDLSFNTFPEIPIPEFFGSLKELRYLNLSKAGFNGVIPTNLGNLSRLQYLDVSSELFSLTVDNLQWVAGLGNLRNLAMKHVDLSMVGSDWIRVLNRLPFLTELDLSGCSLSGFVPFTGSVNFTSLSVVDLSFNSLNSKFPDWLVNITSLVSLDLGENSLHERIPLGISELPNLRYLNLEGNYNLTADCSQLFWGSWRRIEVLNLDNNRVHGKLPDSIGNMTSLVDFNMFSNNIEGGIPSSISSLCKLSNFDLAGNNLTGSLPEFLEGTKNCISRSPLPNLMFMRLSPIPASLGRLSLLRELGLGGNELNGTLPDTLGQFSKLVIFDVSNNNLMGNVSESHFSKLSNLKFLHLSSNSLVLNVSSNWVPPFQVRNLDMGSCQLGPSFPAWLTTQKEIMYLDFSNASISGAIPNWFWDLSSNLSLLNVSHNLLQGQLPNPFKVAPFADVDFSSNLLQGPIPLPAVEIELLDLSDNQFSGPIPANFGEAMPNLIFLSLSGNHIKGEIATSIGYMVALSALDLSRNNLMGSIPSSLGNCSFLKVLDLGSNNLSGVIPWSLGQLKQLQTLHLNDNKFSGDIPLSLQNCSSLETIDLGNNKLSGIIPSWIGENFAALRILRLRSNSFSGRLPSQLTNLSSLQVLDLAENNLIGSIPDSLASLKAMAKIQNVNQYLLYGNYRGRYYEESLVVSVAGQPLKYTKFLSLVTCIDLSSNNLSGEFPEAIMQLLGLMFLNLSVNHISGHIPKGIGDLSELSSLDVSNNQLSGGIPPSMSSLSFLSYLNLSNNNFSGMIPSYGQMATFAESAFSGNPFLCVFPLRINCKGGNSDTGSPAEDTDKDERGNDFIDQWFYLSVGLGFAAGILVPYVVIAIKNPWSDAYFGFVDRIIGMPLWMRNNRDIHRRNERRRR